MDSLRSSDKSLSPRKTTHVSRKSTLLEENVTLKSQLEAAKRRISELESDVERLLTDDSRTRRRIYEQKEKFESEIRELQSKMRLYTGNSLPETLSQAVNETMLAVNSLHHEVLDEVSALQRNAQLRLKMQEEDLNFVHTMKVTQLERELETAKAQIEPVILPEQREMMELRRELGRCQDFNDHLQAGIVSLKQKLKESEAVNEAYIKQHARLIKENSRLRKEVQRVQNNASPRRSIEELPCISIKPRMYRTMRTEVSQGKLTSALKEVKSLKQQLVTERGRKSELRDTLDRCISEVRSQAVSMAAYHGRYRSDMSATERHQVISHLLEDAKVLELVKNEAFKESSRSSSVKIGHNSN